MTTEKQKLSNQLNAQHSSGPKTDEGKRRSALNATRHGLTIPIENSSWASFLPRLESLLMADGYDQVYAMNLARCILEFERNLEHQRYMMSEGDVSFSDDSHLNKSNKSNYKGIFRRNNLLESELKSAARLRKYIIKIDENKNLNAKHQSEIELRNANRHLKRAMNQLFKQCRGISPGRKSMSSLFAQIKSKAI